MNQPQKPAAVNTVLSNHASAFSGVNTAAQQMTSNMSNNIVTLPSAFTNMPRRESVGQDSTGSKNMLKYMPTLQPMLNKLAGQRHAKVDQKQLALTQLLSQQSMSPASSHSYSLGQNSNAMGPPFNQLSSQNMSNSQNVQRLMMRQKLMASCAAPQRLDLNSLYPAATNMPAAQARAPSQFRAQMQSMPLIANNTNGSTTWSNINTGAMMQQMQPL